MKRILLLYSFGISMAVNSMTPPESKLTFLYSHGIADDQTQAFLYTQVNPSNENPIIDNQNHTLVTFNYPDAGQGMIYPKIDSISDLFNLMAHLKTISYKVNRSQTSFAQENEIQAIDEAQADITTPKVLVGASRGASTILTWLATKSQEYTQNVKAVVLESPFGSMDDIVRNILGESLYQYPQARSLGHNIVRFIFSQYKRRGISPISVAANIPKNIPILIVCSKEDARVPAWSSENLAQALKDADHPMVHCITLEHGVHGQLIKGPDGQTYRNTVHAFYKKYGLDHNPEWAELSKYFI
jgi:hypothetical protein